MNDSSRIRELCKKYLTGSLTKEELKQFLEYLDKKEDHEIFREEMMTLLREGKYARALGEDRLTAAVTGILDVIHRSEPEGKTPTRSLRGVLVRSRWRWAAAACFAALAALGMYRWYDAPAGKAHAVAAAPEASPADIRPGGNKAVLTLGNGTQVVLDSLEPGAVVAQGNTRVTKTGGGEISYQAPGSRDESKTISYNTLATPAGGQYQVTLPDGTKVWLNAASSLRYPTRFQGTTRNVEVTGEAYFEVAAVSDMPFVVTHGAVQIRVLGTHFNVNAYRDREKLKVTLVEGSVKVLDTDTREGRLVRPGEQATLDGDGHIALDRDADVEEALAWKNGLFQFTGTGIDEVMDEIARWYNVEVSYSGTITQQFYGKMPRSASLSDVLRMLEMTEGVRFTVQGRKITAMPYQ